MSRVQSFVTWLPANTHTGCGGLWDKRGSLTTQYTSKFEKLNNGHGTGNGQLSFQSQKREMSKNAQTTVQLHSFHMLAR